MKKILLVGNRSLNQEKFKVQNELLFDAAKKYNCFLDIKTNCDVFSHLQENNNLDYDAILFYDKDIYLAKHFENMGKKVYNSSSAILNCDNKALTCLCLEKDNLPMPKTSIIPLLFYYDKNYLNSYIDSLIEKLKLPIICKEWFGSWGEQVYLLKTREEIVEIIEKKKGKELLFQEFIKESSGEDIRVNVVGDRVVASMKRRSINGDFRANISNGGIMGNYIPTKEEEALALRCAKSVGCDFCGVDILQSTRGPLVCAINANAHLINIKECSGVNVGEEIIKYILKKEEIK